MRAAKRRSPRLSWRASTPPIRVRPRPFAPQPSRGRGGRGARLLQEHAGEWDKIRALHVAEKRSRQRWTGARARPFLCSSIRHRHRAHARAVCGPRRARSASSRNMLAYARVKLSGPGSPARRPPRRSLQCPASRWRRRWSSCIRCSTSSTICHVLPKPRGLEAGGKLRWSTSRRELEFLREQSAHRRLGCARTDKAVAERCRRDGGAAARPRSGG